MPEKEVGLYRLLVTAKKLKVMSWGTVLLLISYRHITTEDVCWLISVLANIPNSKKKKNRATENKPICVKVG